MPLILYKPKNSRNWYYRGTVRGIHVDRSTLTDNEAAAEAIRIKAEAQILDRSVFGARATVTFVEASLSYLKQGGEGRFLDPIMLHFKGRKLADIAQADIDAAAEALLPHATPATRNRQVYTPISAVLRHAARRGWTDRRIIDRPRQKEIPIRWITQEEATRLVANCAQHLAPLVIFLFGTGARLSEALYLQWSQVNLKERQVTFPKTKNGEARSVPLPPKAFEALANLPHRLGAVFLTNRGLPYQPNDDGGGQIKTAFKGACRRAGIHDFTPHKCRHSWATWHYAKNKDIGHLMELGGWKSVEMAMRYAHVNVSHLASSQQAIGW